MKITDLRKDIENRINAAVSDILDDVFGYSAESLVVTAKEPTIKPKRHYRKHRKHGMLELLITNGVDKFMKSNKQEIALSKLLKPILRYRTSNTTGTDYIKGMTIADNHGLVIDKRPLGKSGKMKTFIMKPDKSLILKSF